MEKNKLLAAAYLSSKMLMANAHKLKVIHKNKSYLHIGMYNCGDAKTQSLSPCPSVSAVTEIKKDILLKYALFSCEKFIYCCWSCCSL